MKTLVIDDEKAVRDCICRLFEGFGQCDEAEDGLEGLEYINKTHYDIIILDVVLPELDGHTLIKRIRALELDDNIDPLDEAKILVLSRRKDEPTVLQAFRNGATGWIGKPVNGEKIKNNLKKLGYACES